MALLQSPKKITLFSPDSSTFTVLADTPTEIPEQFMVCAIRAGCMLLPGEYEPEAPEPLALSVADAITQVINEGDASKFNSDGLPKATAIKPLIGRPIGYREIRQVWDSLQAE